jgi:Rhodanese-like domain
MRSIASFGLALVACTDPADATADLALDVRVDPERVAQTPGVQLLDARSAEAYAQAHAAGAVHFDASSVVRENGERVGVQLRMI